MVTLRRTSSKPILKIGVDVLASMKICPSPVHFVKPHCDCAVRQAKRLVSSSNACPVRTTKWRRKGFDRGKSETAESLLLASAC